MCSLAASTSLAGFLLVSIAAITSAAAATPPITYSGAGGEVVQFKAQTPLLREGNPSITWYPQWLGIVADGEVEVLGETIWWSKAMLSLPAGWEIGPKQPIGHWLGAEQFEAYYAQFDPSTPNGIFLAIRLSAGGQSHRYGWIHIGVMYDVGVGSPTTVLHGWAIHDVPDAPIVAGAVPYLPSPDLNGDGEVGAPDLAIVLGAWGGPGLGDLDADGVVDAADLVTMLGAWGPVATPCGAATNLCVAVGDVGALGCSAGACCATVCGIDPFCCVLQWDNLCAQRALATCGAEGWPPECQAVVTGGDDCNGNGIVDACEAAAGLVSEADCDGDGVYDWCVLLSGLDGDCDGNGLPDGCEIARGLQEDCNGDGVPDACQGAAPIVDTLAALRFVEGAHHVLVPDFGLVMPTAEITIEFWQKVDAVAQQNTFTLVGSPDSNRVLAHTPWSDGVVYWDFGNFTSGGRLAYAPPEPIVGSWHHFAFVASRAGNFMRIYRNGVLEASKVGSQEVSAGPFDFAMGGVLPYGYRGLLDEFRIWDRARTGAEIAADFDRAVDVNTPGLLASWRFDEAAGLTAADAAGRNHGALVGPPAWSERLDCTRP